ncbi:helix-turn-helix domain-containing protein [Lapidilactobacillus bayanensis]|uniref:helix-turn-helix domain-containing protein n=1 Tax=Lapidilactobacillus bayanensis TaxID=2485998 RepID=UPI000F798D04|nr:helix-turn-helix domain-containing protein [Lapidilactobacillus bayanensis]
MDLNINLREARKHANLSQEEVATRLNISRQAISQWENGKSCPDIDNLKLLADIYDISIDDMLKEKANSITKPDELTIEEPIQESLVKSENPTDESIILMLLSCVLFPIAPIGIVIAPFIIWRNKKTNRFWRLVLILAICVLLYSLFVMCVGFANYLNWGITSYK